MENIEIRIHKDIYDILSRALEKVANGEANTKVLEALDDTEFVVKSWVIPADDKESLISLISNAYKVVANSLNTFNKSGDLV